MWVYEETIDGRKLTEIINTEHENVKYLPGHKLPKNVVSFFTKTRLILSPQVQSNVRPHAVLWFLRYFLTVQMRRQKVKSILKESVVLKLMYYDIIWL